MTPLLAHGIEGGRQDLPIPEELFVAGAALVLIVSFAALTTFWTSPKLEEDDPGRRLVRLPAAVDVVLGAVGIALFAAVVYAGLTGSDVPEQNFAPNFVYVLFWVGLVPVSLLFGDVFRLLSPWRSIARATRWVATRRRSDGLPAPIPWPERLGRWPAVLGLLVFAFLELVAVDGSDPRLVAVVAILYMVTMLVGMMLFGIETWTRHADAFAVYFGFFARLSPWARRDGHLVLRRPAAGMRDFAGAGGTVALLCAAIGTTSFDGLTGGGVWKAVQSPLISFWESLGLPYARASEAALTLALVGSVLLIALVYAAGVRGMRTVRGARRDVNLSQRFAVSLIPIAAAYALAHYYSLLMLQGQSTVQLGGDLVAGRTSTPSPDYSVLSANSVWYFQVGALVLGHAAGLALAHDRALAIYPSVQKATRSQLWMLLVMVAFTMLGLWLLSSIN